MNTAHIEFQDDVEKDVTETALENRLEWTINELETYEGLSHDDIEQMIEQGYEDTDYHAETMVCLKMYKLLTDSLQRLRSESVFAFPLGEDNGYVTEALDDYVSETQSDKRAIAARDVSERAIQEALRNRRG